MYKSNNFKDNLETIKLLSYVIMDKSIIKYIEKLDYTVTVKALKLKYPANLI